jgi:hypothetical protein
MSDTSSSRQRRTIETDAFLRMAARMLRAGGKRVSEGDAAELADLIALRNRLDDAILVAVAGLRQSGHTWQEIGDATGTTRQAAIMKWSHRILVSETAARKGRAAPGLLPQ